MVYFINQHGSTMQCATLPYTHASTACQRSLVYCESQYKNGQDFLAYSIVILAPSQMVQNVQEEYLYLKVA